MKKITYLFGAGASCEVMPLNLQIPDRLQDLVKCIESLNYLPDSGEYERRAILISDLKWLWEGSRNHASVDTFAKKLYIRQKWKDLKTLRLALSVFFTCEQMGKMPDKRYDAFFASLLDSNITSLPSNINVLSWNYDYQFELSFMGFSDSKNVKEVHPYLGCVNKYQDYFHDTHERFQFFKLNGDISLREGNSQSATRQPLNNFSQILTDKTFKEVLNNWYLEKESGGDFCCNISFAWERSGNGFLEYVIQQLKSSEILVVIGYSFPYFNREIDRRLIGGMKNLKKVYLQAPDAIDLAERFMAIDNRSDLEVVKRFDKNQFLIPNEL